MTGHIAVLGGTGFVGHAVCEHLVEHSGGAGRRIVVPTRRMRHGLAIQRRQLHRGDDIADIHRLVQRERPGRSDPLVQDPHLAGQRNAQHAKRNHRDPDEDLRGQENTGHRAAFLRSGGSAAISPAA